MPPHARARLAAAVLLAVLAAGLILACVVNAPAISLWPIGRAVRPRVSAASVHAAARKKFAGSLFEAGGDEVAI
jgi:hypothetical protein